MKLLNIPFGSKTVEAVETWEVRWISRHGSFNSDTRPQIEVFTDETSAKEFANALKEAFKLIKHTGDGTYVIVGKR